MAELLTRGRFVLNVYITFFDVGKDSEALIIDNFERTEEIVMWNSKEDYFQSRKTDPKPIDGGIYSYGLAAAVSIAPDAVISERIVSYRAPDSLLSLLNRLDSLVRDLRNAEWPEWPEC